MISCVEESPDCREDPSLLHIGSIMKRIDHGEDNLRSLPKESRHRVEATSLHQTSLLKNQFIEGACIIFLCHFLIWSKALVIVWSFS